ncbi:M3 family metallopeptidase [Glaciecola sp. KUL10]|uniref:M3 family metallopeptidase n=1 Tax=Glaciecola sp. (strain KUL10) TaxID=2161813 RepID=UPI000D787621|nr:M3 family metallopeptidase [Glaciecola sp. KUL10]GBL03736.1 peptidyl-dipeptidase dcp [Glaciecola sp. KUL10]
MPSIELKRSGLALAIAISLSLSGCSKQVDDTNANETSITASDVDQAALASNPFFQDWDTPFNTPPFGKIKTEHYKPAFQAAMKEHKAEITNIANADSTPDFDNTIAQMELAGARLTRVARVFFNVANTESDDDIQSLQREFSPMLSRHNTEITMNPDLFARVKAVYNKRNESNLNAEQLRLLDRVYDEFVRAGANLEGEEREQFAQINERLSSLTTSFGQNSLNDARAFTLTLEETDLEGLPQSLIDAAAAQAKSRGLEGKYVITLNRSSVQPFLQFSARRDLREKAFKGWAMRGDNDNEFDNKANIQEIVALRAQRAKLLGYKHHSDFVLSDAMAGTPQAAMDLLLKVWEPAVAKAEQEKQWIEEVMAQEGVEHKLEPWDWRYYAEKVRKARFDLDQAEITEYFELNNMIDAQFYVANKLFSLSFEERQDVPVYNDVVRVWEVKDATGNSLGLFYGDYYARETKRSGAWMSAFRTQQKLAGDVKPLILNNMNLNKPADGEPTLMTYSDAVTLFHEFGHALHGLLSDVTYPTLAGTSVPRDWVEFPAQIYEHFIAQPYMLEKFARHYKTDEPMPSELIERIKSASTFNQGFATVEFTASALVDMAYHQLSTVEDLDIRAFEDRVLSEYGKPEEIIMRHRSTHFGHIFAGGYSSAYYAYMWSEILDADGFDAFLEAGNIFDKETADRLKEFVFSTGDTMEYIDAYKGFRGRAPTTDALLRNRGLDRGTSE